MKSGLHVNDVLNKLLKCGTFSTEFDYGSDYLTRNCHESCK